MVNYGMSWCVWEIVEDSRVLDASLVVSEVNGRLRPRSWFEELVKGSSEGFPDAIGRYW